MRAVIFFSFLLAGSIKLQSGFAQQWELRRNEDGIAVYSRKLTDENFKQLRVVCELPGTPDQLKALLQDVSRQKTWVYGTRTSQLIKKINKDKLIYYSESDLPWPVSDRDIVVEQTFITDQKTQTLHIEAKSVSGLLPDKKNLVRVPYSLAVWEVVPLPANKLKVDYTFSVNPGGELPAWLVNATAAAGPFVTFQKLRKILEAGSGKQE
jgi:hypothetical protein